jgi:hypothetical protein
LLLYQCNQCLTPDEVSGETGEGIYTGFVALSMQPMFDP